MHCLSLPGPAAEQHHTAWCSHLLPHSRTLLHKRWALLALQAQQSASQLRGSTIASSDQWIFLLLALPFSKGRASPVAAPPQNPLRWTHCSTIWQHECVCACMRVCTCLMGSGTRKRQQECVRRTAVSTLILWPTDTYTGLELLSELRSACRKANDSSYCCTSISLSVIVIVMHVL